MNIFQKQAIMRKVIYALIPIFIFSIYLYGWRVLSLTSVVFLFGILTEYIVERSRKKKVSEAVLVTCALYALSLPPAVPHWIAAVGIVFGVFIGKEVFGGFGRNIFNPAITGRLFIYITFPTVLAESWMVPGNFGLLGSAGVDAVTAATPLALFNNGGELPDLIMRLFGVPASDFVNMFFGFRGGSIGESSMLLIIVAAVMLLAKKTAQWRLIVSAVIAEVVLTCAFYFSGLAPHLPPHLALMSGSLMYVAVFMCTDPITAPNKPAAQWLYGIVIGSSAIIIRSFSAFPEGTSFAIFIGNVFASLFDQWMPKAKKKAPSKSVKKTQAKPSSGQATA